ncbi:MAG: 50S ribosomal protein L18 [Parcubacteria group bacterium]|nr:50S ribosomal protein L18 [Parcubacteria group bacterium]
MTHKQHPYNRRHIRHRRIRSRVKGTAAQPRLATYRSSKYIYVQAIDDERGMTLCAVSDRELSSKKRSKTERAREVGKAIAQKLKAQDHTRVVFDRGGYAYHGRVRALADAAREEGLQF